MTGPSHVSNPYHVRVGTGHGPADCVTDHGDVVGAYYTPRTWTDPAAGFVTAYINGHEARLSPHEARALARILDRMAGEAVA